MTILFSEIAAYARDEFHAEISPVDRDIELAGLATNVNWRSGRLAFAVEVDPALEVKSELVFDGILIVGRDAPALGCPHIRVDNPRLAFAQIAEHFFVEKPEPGIHPTAIIDGTATVDSSATVGPYCVIGPRCSVGADAVLHTHVSLAKDVHVGPECVLWSHCVLGEDGFGIERESGKIQKRLPHFGGVVLGRGVHIGNFAAIAGGTIEPTRIGDGTMIDNLVHIAHNVHTGKNCQIIACAEVSGSVRLHDNVTIAPNATVIQKIEIGENSLLGLGAVATKSIPANVIAAGVPAKVIRNID